MNDELLQSDVAEYAQARECLNYWFNRLGSKFESAYRYELATGVWPYVAINFGDLETE